MDPDFHNSAEQVWASLIRQHNQIFLVLCGHHVGQAGVDAGRAKPSVGIGDGWLRLMQFDFSARPLTISVKTYSSYYGRFSGEVENCAIWYKGREPPSMTDPEFHAADDFTLRQDDFFEHFGKPGEVAGD